MASRRSSGLSLGQVLTLTLGFLVASLLIFVFGVWVGKDFVERRLAKEERIVRKRAQPAEPLPAEPETAVVAAGEATATAVRVVATTVTPAARPTLARVVSAPTVTPARAARPAPAPVERARPAAPAREEWADAGWTVQVYATTDPNQATALARRLVAKGYDAYTLQAPMRGQTWYRVRVGRFGSHERAREMEQRLKSLEGMEAAYVTAQ
jgi:cell division protein FtsN